MNAQEVFDSFMFREGGRLDLEQVAPEACELTNNLLYMASMAFPDDIIYDIINNGKFGAVAKSHGTTKICGIQYGLIIFLTELFYDLAKGFDTNFEYLAGQPPQTIEFELRDTLRKLKEPDEFNYKNWAPRHAERDLTEFQAAIGACCSILAFQFVLNHERSHLELGHLEYLSKKYTHQESVLSLNETQLVDTFQDSSQLRDLRAVEYLADNRAAQLVTYFIYSIQQTNESGTANAIQLLANPQYSHGLFLFASTIMTFCFWQLEGGIERIDHAHPHPEIRHTGIMIGHFEAIKTCFGSNSEAEMLVVRRSFQKMDSALNRLFPVLAGNFDGYLEYHNQTKQSDIQNDFMKHVQVVHDEIQNL